ncbi:MAG: helix-turn-helix domain-containing protein [Chloroflexi bacterium]|nr:helix-turn-helix domain-containing protein [Chloroflexota bacterium]
MIFGERLRQLRKASGMSQRELAEKVEIDFTYLSKIETGRMPPPSEKTILALAEVLGADADELLVLAHRIPSDLARNVDLETVRLLRRSLERRVTKPEDWDKIEKPS